jgi:hypothetical protein
MLSSILIIILLKLKEIKTMKVQHSRRRILKWVGGLGLLSALWPPQLAQAEEPATSDAGIVGSWLVSVSYTSGVDNTKGLATFTADGCFIGSVTGYVEAPAKPTPSRGTTLHGSWLRTDFRDYEVTALRLHLEQDGTMLGTMKTQIALTLDKTMDAWSGTFRFDAVAPTGEVLRTDDGTLAATRIKVELT